MINQADQSFLTQHLNFWDHITPDEQALLFQNTNFISFTAGQSLSQPKSWWRNTKR